MEMRGLRNFIDYYVNGTSLSPDAHAANEMAKIKKLFFSKKAKLYDKRKSIAKLCFLALMGHNVLFGFPQMVELLNSQSFADKRIGYMAAVLVCNTYPECSVDLIGELKKLLSDLKNENYVNLALSVVASVGGSKFADSLGPTVADIAIGSTTADQIRKKALLALSRLYQSSQQLPVVDKVCPRVGQLLRSRNLGVAMSCSLLALTLVQSQTTAIGDIFHVTIEVLTSLFTRKQCPPEYLRHGIPCPFLCARLFRLLLYKLSWDADEVSAVDQVAKVMLEMNDNKKNIEGQTPFLFVFSEAAITLTQIPLPDETFKLFIPVLVTYLSQRTFAMEALTNLVQAAPRFAADLQHCIKLLLDLVQSRSPIVDKKALQLLYFIANKDNCGKIIKVLLPFVRNSPLRLRPDLCTKLAVLTQSFGNDVEWKAKTLLKLVENGEDAGELIWTHTSQAIIDDKANTNDHAISLLTRIETNLRISSPLMKIAAYVVGISCSLDPAHVAEIFMTHFAVSHPSAQASIISCLQKLAMKNPEIKDDVIYFLDESITSPYFEVAQRSQETRAILQCNFLCPSISTAPDGYVDTTITFGSTKVVSLIDPLSQFFSGTKGTIYVGPELTVGASIVEVESKSARVTIVLRIENHSASDLKISKFEVLCENNLRSKIADECLIRIGAKQQTAITIYFVAMDAFADVPSLIIGYESNEVIMKVPVLPRFFMNSYELPQDKFSQKWKETAKPGQTGSSLLILPDGDVLSEVDKTVRRWMNLSPLSLTVKSNSLFMSGSFATFNGKVGILLHFIFDDDEMMLSLDVHSTSPTATSAIIKIAKRAFPQSDINE